MANEIQVTAALQYTNAAKNIAAQLLQIAGGLKTFNITGQNFALGSKSFATTAGGVAIPVSNLANLGWAFFLNLDPANFVKLISAVSGTVFGRIYPGEIAMFRFDTGITAPAIQADTAACEVAYLILEI